MKMISAAFSTQSKGEKISRRLPISQSLISNR